MSRASRLFELLELLESSGTRNVAELATRLAVDERTVRRDITALQDLGVPVESTRGRHGGYRIGAGHRMPPLMLNDAEALGVLHALLHAAAEPAGTVQPVAVATATAKVRRGLPRRLAERADALLQVAVLAPGRAPDRDGAGLGTVDPDALLTIAAAVRDRRPVELDYRNRLGETSRRSVQPHDLVAYGGRWYLAGFDAPSHEVRTFRIDRIRTVRVLGGTFPKPPPHDPTTDLVQRFAGADYRHLVMLRVRATVADVRRVLPASVARVEHLDDGWVHVTIHAESLAWLPATLLTLDREVIIERPDELRTAVAEAAARLSAIAQGSRSVARGAPAAVRALDDRS